MLFRSLLLTGLLSVLGCLSTNELMIRGQYDKAIKRYAAAPRTEENVQGLETAFQRAQERDLKLADSLRMAEDSVDWIALHACYARLQRRQTDMLARHTVRARNGYTPQFSWLGDIDSLELESRRQAADQRYSLALSLLPAARRGEKSAARWAWEQLNAIARNYFPVWKDSESLLNETRELGTEYVLVAFSGAYFFHRDQLLREARLDHCLDNTQWRTYHVGSHSDVVYDYELDIEILSFDVGPEQRTECSRTVEKDIFKEYKWVYDTAGKVVDKIPVYEKVSGTVTEVRLTKEARVRLHYRLMDVNAGRTMNSEMVALETGFDETWVSTSGDNRAVDHVAASIGAPAAPNDWAMVADLAQVFRERTRTWLDQHL